MGLGIGSGVEGLDAGGTELLGELEGIFDGAGGFEDGEGFIEEADWGI